MGFDALREPPRAQAEITQVRPPSMSRVFSSLPASLPLLSKTFSKVFLKVFKKNFRYSYNVCHSEPEVYHCFPLWLSW